MYPNPASLGWSKRALEDFYGTALFERHENRLTITEAGRTLYSIAKTIVQDFDDSVELMKSLQEKYQFTLSVGASRGVGEYLLPKLLGDFKKMYPDAKITMKINTTDHIVEGVSQGIFHIGIVEGEFDYEAFHTEFLMEDELILIVGPMHRWATRKIIHFPEVIHEQAIRRMANSEVRMRVEKELRKYNLLDKITSFIEFESTEAIKNAVEYGLGISFVSRIAVEKELAEGRLVEVAIRNVKITRPILSHYPKKTVSPCGHLKICPNNCRLRSV